MEGIITGGNSLTGNTCTMTVAVDVQGLVLLGVESSAASIVKL